MLLFALLEGAHGSLKKVKALVSYDASTVRSAAAVFAVEGEDAVRFVGIADVELVLNPLPTKGKLVFAVHPGDVIVNGKGVVVEMGNRICSAADIEFAFCHLQSVLHGLIES